MDTTKRNNNAQVLISTLEELQGFRKSGALYIPDNTDVKIEPKTPDDTAKIAEALLETHRQLRGATDAPSRNLLERIENLLKQLLDNIINYFKTQSQSFASDADIAYFAVKEGDLAAFKEALPNVDDERFQLLEMAAERKDAIGNDMVREIVDNTHPAALICLAADQKNAALLTVLQEHGIKLNDNNCAALKMCMKERDLTTAAFIVKQGAGLTTFLKETRSMLSEGELSGKDKDFIASLKEACKTEEHTQAADRDAKQEASQEMEP